MECEVCNTPYNDSDHKPRNLKCGHAFCTSCLKSCVKQDTLSCPICREKMNRVIVDLLPVNYPLLDLINTKASISASAQVGTVAKKSSVVSEAQIGPYSHKGHKWSPHGSMCLQNGASIEYHCAKCQLWLCEACARIEHSGPSCLVTLQKETLSEMVDSSRAKGESACKALRISKEEMVSYGNKLLSCEVIMETTLDCIRKEKKRLEKLSKDFSTSEERLTKIIRTQTSPDLPEVLSMLQTLDINVSDSQKWAAGVLSTFMDDKAFKLSKDLLLAMVQLHLASSGHGSCSEVVALHTINATPLSSRLTTDGLRLYLHALTQMDPPSGARGLPLERVMCCIDTSTTLTFLDLSWGTSNRGRVFIRLYGDSSRAQQFLLMCIGNKGPTFCRTRFHRMWWKGQPGEHVWAGDYDAGDGSGGLLPSDITAAQKRSEKSGGQKLPITAGLVAGVYGKDSNSSIFRIYTKDSQDSMEEAAFGRVEYGLQILDAAIQHNNITDVKIADCGVVIEP